jgi:hypothetical protein
MLRRFGPVGLNTCSSASALWPSGGESETQLNRDDLSGTQRDTEQAWYSVLRSRYCVPRSWRGLQGWYSVLRSRYCVPRSWRGLQGWTVKRQFS